MKLFDKFRRSRAPLESPRQRCLLLEAPVEVRIMIYERITEGSFLPHVPYREYIGLFLSCKQICAGMQQECLRAAPPILEALEDEAGLDSLLRLRPVHPLTFASLNHLTIGMPSWAFFSRDAQQFVLEITMKVLQMHLSSVTIGLEDIKDLWDAVTCINALDTAEFSEFMLAWRYVQDHPINDEEDYYNIRTTYDGVAKFASRINCVVAQGICAGKHDHKNHFCLRSGPVLPPTGIPCNVRKVVLRLKKLHDEALCHCGKLPHDVYPLNTNWARWNPAFEEGQLLKEGWKVSWYNDKGKVHVHSGRKPVVFVWEKVEKKASPKVLWRRY